MNRLEKLKLTLAREVANQLACPALRSMYPSTSRGQMCDLFEDLYKTGWEKASAEYEKIIAELEGDLDKIGGRQLEQIAGMYEMIAEAALDKLKDFRGGE